MATYKVLQDIEAEDKLIGPLTLRQFIYAVIGALFLWLSYMLATRGAAFMLVVFLPITGIAAFFAFPWMRDQPTEVWALAKIRFMFKPRRRVWNQDGIKELVTITAPKKVNMDYTNGLTQQEVRSRLRALATTVDTRGWALKNSNVNLSLGTHDIEHSDRLVAPIAPAAKAVDDADIRASDDILDENNNAGAQRLKSMISQKEQSHRQQIMDSLNDDTPATKDNKQPTNDYWFLNNSATPGKVPAGMVTFNTTVVAPGSDTSTSASTDDDEAKALAELNAHQTTAQTSITGHMHSISPVSKQTPTKTEEPAQQNPAAPVTPVKPNATIALAENNDLNVSTIAKEAKRNTSEDEVVVNLH